MEKVIITEQDILNANSSIPLVLKWTLAKYIAEVTPEKKTIVVKENGKESIPLPDMVQRRTMMESQFKIGVFVKEYMGRDFDPVHDMQTDKPVPYLMAADEADAWSNFEAQLDRLKRSKKEGVADKCYDILNDYHAFVRMVSIEIEQELQIKNDLLGRAAWFLTSLLGKFTAEDLKNSLNDIAKLAENLEETGEMGPVSEDENPAEE